MVTLSYTDYSDLTCKYPACSWSWRSKRGGFSTDRSRVRCPTLLLDHHRGLPLLCVCLSPHLASALQSSLQTPLNHLVTFWRHQQCLQPSRYPWRQSLTPGTQQCSPRAWALKAVAEPRFASFVCVSSRKVPSRLEHDQLSHGVA